MPRVGIGIVRSFSSLQWRSSSEGVGLEGPVVAANVVGDCVVSVAYRTPAVAGSRSHHGADALSRADGTGSLDTACQEPWTSIVPAIPGW
jgi:hypothetical protein